MTLHLGICCALSAEARTLINKKIDPGEVISLDARTRLILSGMGAERARNAAEVLIDSGCTALLSWGVAAALEEKLAPGSLVLPEAIISAAGEHFPVHRHWHTTLCSLLSRTLDIHTGILIESPNILTDAYQKRRLLHTQGAIAADMESAATAAVATRAKVAYMAIRAVSDTVSMRVPRRVTSKVDAVGRIGLKSVLLDVIMNPKDWPDIARLGMGMQAACSALDRVCASIAKDCGSLRFHA